MTAATALEWRQFAGWIKRNFGDRLNERERSFIETMSRWQGWPTVRQQEWLRKIAERFVEVAA